MLKLRRLNQQAVSYTHLDVYKRQALLRRAQILNEHKIVIGSTEFDYDAMTVTTDKESLVLPKKEFLLLYKLCLLYTSRCV